MTAHDHTDTLLQTEKHVSTEDLSRSDADILRAEAAHLYGRLTFERAVQDRRTYYRLLCNGRGIGSLTTAAHARETIAYWGLKGWRS